MSVSTPVARREFPGTMQSRDKTIRDALAANDLAAVVSLAKTDRKALSCLVRISYDKDTLAGWRAIKAMGLIARELLEIDIVFLRETCRRLLWSISDESGGIGWSAPELLGEIVSAAPGRFPDITPLIVSVYDAEEVTFRPGVLYALQRIAEASPLSAVPYADILLRGMREKDPLARVHALEAFCVIAQYVKGPELSAFKEALPALLKDTTEVIIYKENDFTHCEVSQSASKLSRLISGS